MENTYKRRRIGHGAMSLVDLVINPTSGEQWAEKFMAPHQKNLERYLHNEAEILEKLQGNIFVPKYLGMTQYKGNDILRMEYVEGILLNKAIRKNYTSHRKRNLFADLLSLGEGLLNLEERNIVHRDIKPSNVILNPQNAMATIIDFGIAYDADREDIVEEGIIVGSPMYMSPEQARGEKLTPQSDQFSYSTIAFQALTYQDIFEENRDYQMALFCYGREEQELNKNRLEHATKDPELSIAWALCADPDPKMRTMYPLLKELQRYSESYEKML